MPFKYLSSVVPEGYACSCCAKTGVKLWRDYMSSNPSLYCASCAVKDPGEDLSTLDAEGCILSDLGVTDQLGSLVPAVPCEDDTGYWGYTSVPDIGVAWWKALPNGL